MKGVMIDIIVQAALLVRIVLQMLLVDVIKVSTYNIN